MRESRRPVLGLGLVVLGALLGMLAMTALPWYRSSFNGILGDGSSPSDIRASIALYENQPAALQPLFSLGVSPLYFRWLGVVVLLAAALSALVGSGLDARRARLVAGLAVALSLAGLVLTGFAVRFVALDGTRLRRTVPGWSDFVAQSGPGLWAMTLALVLVGAGAVLAAGSRAQLRELLAADPAAGPAADPTPAVIKSDLRSSRRPQSALDHERADGAGSGEAAEAADDW